jgi:hypothetical protein
MTKKNDGDLRLIKALSAVAPERRAEYEHKASEAIYRYVERLASGEIEYDGKKFERLMMRNYIATLTGGTIRGTEIATKALGLRRVKS